MAVTSVEHERFSETRFTPPWIRHEHRQRFAFASTFARDAVVVDCACGSGIGTRMFAEAGASSIHAFDISPTAIAATQASCARFTNVIAREADAADLPIPGGTADLYVSFETIEHVGDAAALLREARRVLKAGGTFICSTPNRYVYSPGHDLAATPWNRFHVREYDVREFQELLLGVFSHCSIYGQNRVPRWRSSVLDGIGRSSPANLAVRLNQALKLSRFLYDRADWHAVEEARSGTDYEYSVAVCRP